MCKIVRGRPKQLGNNSNSAQLQGPQLTMHLHSHIRPTHCQVQFPAENWFLIRSGIAYMAKNIFRKSVPVPVRSLVLSFSYGMDMDHAGYYSHHYWDYRQPVAPASWPTDSICRTFITVIS